ncbi:MAG TPA: hypothetical protein ENG34_01250, partial [Candidatus Aenigmarchaeota archaeon]|nr:hypothetical protein [Candidatus Aenigmarchaeota archaeon]
NITGVVEQPTTIPTTTPTPKPTPTPTPTPTAGVGVQPGETQIAIEIEPINHTVRGEQGQWIPNVINVTNIGNANVTDIVLIPIVPEGWEVKTALISFLGVGETLNRTVFVKPPYTALGTYAIPIKAVKGNVTLDIDYYWVEVLEALNRTVLQLIEVPKVIYMRTSNNLTVAILARNAGKIPLHNISVRLENIENCLDWFGFEGIEELGANETGQISLYLRSKGVPAACNSTLIAWSKEGAYAFADIYIVVTQPLFILPIPRIPFLLLLLLLVEFVLLKMKKKNEENILINAAFYIVFVAIVLLLTYVILWYLGLIKSLP